MEPTTPDFGPRPCPATLQALDHLRQTAQYPDVRPWASWCLIMTVMWGAHDICNTHD